MTATTHKQLKRTVEALQRINSGEKFQILTRKWVDPIDRNRVGFLRIDGRVTTLLGCKDLGRHTALSTSDNVRMLVAVLRDHRKCARLWLWIWDSDRGVHIIEPAGTDVEALDKDLAHRFPNA